MSVLQRRRRHRNKLIILRSRRISIRRSMSAIRKYLLANFLLRPDNESSLLSLAGCTNPSHGMLTLMLLSRTCKKSGTWPQIK